MYCGLIYFLYLEILFSLVLSSSLFSCYRPQFPFIYQSVEVIFLCVFQTKYRDTDIKLGKKKERTRKKEKRERATTSSSPAFSFHQLASAIVSPGYLKPWQQQVSLPIWDLECHLLLTKRKCRLLKFSLFTVLSVFLFNEVTLTTNWFLTYFLIPVHGCGPAEWL